MQREWKWLVGILMGLSAAADAAPVPPGAYRGWVVGIGVAPAARSLPKGARVAWARRQTMLLAQGDLGGFLAEPRQLLGVSALDSG